MEAGIWRAGWHFGCHWSVHLPTGGDLAKRKGGSREGEGETGCVCGSETDSFGGLLIIVSEDFVH